ncbi:MAG: glycosyl hydrolase family 17 [Saprospiraceae bacterium]|nr:glycosyl hydrolase family 17 [Saprospiraceae bacterium]
MKATPKASEILGNPEYLAISYGGYRHVDHSIEPTMDELKEDLHILSAMGVRMLRTYKLHKPHASNLVKAISEIKKENPEFEMYVMLGVWINCADAFTEHPNHEVEDSAANKSEIDKAVALAQAYPEVIKVIAVGNEAMVKWATSYYVQPGVILRWVNHLQELKKSGALPKDLWITSSDNFASWGGGGEEYHVDELTRLIQAVDFISLHTYPMHDTHYNPAFWGTKPEDASLSLEEKIEVAMQRALEYAQFQFQSTEDYVKRLGIEKPIHIGETGWASYSNGHYGDAGSKATDEYKEAIYYGLLRDWTNVAGISCFYFEAFDEVWKDAANPGGSENHFGLITVDGKAKFALWDLVDQGIFEHCTRGGNPITKTFQGDRTALIASLELPPTMKASSD